MDAHPDIPQNTRRFQTASTITTNMKFDQMPQATKDTNATTTATTAHSSIVP